MLVLMRTTLTLDPDVHALLKKATHRSKRPFKQVLNDAVRAGLAAQPRHGDRFVQPVFSMGRPRVDLTKALALAADFEDQQKLAKRK